jgi:hypothetical protein
MLLMCCPDSKIAIPEPTPLSVLLPSVYICITKVLNYTNRDVLLTVDHSHHSGKHVGKAVIAVQFCRLKTSEFVAIEILQVGIMIIVCNNY